MQQEKVNLQICKWHHWLFITHQIATLWIGSIFALAYFDLHHCCANPHQHIESNVENTIWGEEREIWNIGLATTPRAGEGVTSVWGQLSLFQRREGRRDNDKCFCNCFWNALFKFQKCIRENGKQTMGTPKYDGKLAIEPPGNKKWVTCRLRLCDLSWFQPNMTISICSGSIPM